MKSINARLAGIILALAGVGLHAQAAFANVDETPTGNAPVEALSMDELKDVFWTCDYAATRYGMDLPEGAYCVQVTERLKSEYFDGYHEEMLRWWLDNRTVQHARLAGQIYASYSRPEFETP
jgi:hypothetical protein